MTTSDGYVKGVSKVVDHGESSRKWTLLIFGDGYRDSELVKFETDVQDFINTLHNTKPFDQLWNGINIYQIDVVSIESGADDPTTCGGTGAVPKTYFDATYCDSGLRRLLVVNNSTVRSTANVAVPEWDMLMVIVNSPIHGGTGGEVAVFSNTMGASEIGIHEIGHTAFGLADEYNYFQGCNSGETGHDVYTGFEPIEPNVTINVNRNSIKWKTFILDTTPLPTTSNADCNKCDPQQSPVQPSIVGAFEGARYFHCGIYRPEFNCKMRELGYPFCTVCQYIIKERLLSYLVEYSAHVVFNTRFNGGPIMYKSTREPINPLTAVSISNRDDFYPAIACVYNNIYIAYRNISSNQIFLRKSTNFGDSFQPENIIVDNTTKASPIVELAATADKVYVTWVQFVRQPPYYEEGIFFRRSIDGGATFPRNLNTENLAYGTGSQRKPKIAAWENLVFLMWSANLSGLGDPDQYVMVARSTNSGDSFSSINVIGNGNWDTDITISQIITRPGEPPIVSVVWSEAGLTSKIYYRRSINGGVSFEEPLTLATDFGSSPIVDSYYDHTIYVRYGQSGQPVYRISTDYGASFGPVQPVNTFEDLAAVENNVYIIRRKGGTGSSTFLTFNKSIDGGQTFGHETALVDYLSGINVGSKPSIAISRL